MIIVKTIRKNCHINFHFSFHEAGGKFLCVSFKNVLFAAVIIHHSLDCSFVCTTRRKNSSAELELTPRVVEGDGGNKEQKEKRAAAVIKRASDININKCFIFRFISLRRYFTQARLIAQLSQQRKVILLVMWVITRWRCLSQNVKIINRKMLFNSKCSHYARRRLC